MIRKSAGIVRDPPSSNPIWRLYFFSLMIVAGLLVLLVALGYRQLFEGKYWAEQMAQSSTRIVKIPAPRGDILDRNGVVLVANRPSYNVALYLDEFRVGRNSKKLLEEVRTTVDSLKRRMKMHVNVSDQTVRGHYQKRGPLPLTVWNDLSPAALAAFEERSPWRQGGGVDLQIEPVRVYPFGTLASHVLGFVGKPETSSQEQDDFDFDGRKAFSQPNLVGKSGIEATMDRELQGVAGLRLIKLNAAGLKEAEVSRSLPTPGNSVVLTLDQQIQSIVEEAFTGFRGACVILDPRNGDILAMASAPTFDPNQFVPAIKKSDWLKLVRDRQLPMMNRAIQGSYSPGSTFKVIVSLAALESGAITPGSVIECPGRFYLGNIEFKCWDIGGHGDMKLRDAITMSCNVFFYNLGKKLGGEPIWEMASAFHLGQKTGVPLDHEEAGLLGTQEWKRKRNARDRWTVGDSVNMAIGQGLLNVTPLQMAMVAATFGNGGTVYKPRLVLRIETSDREVITDFQPQIYGQIPVSPQNMKFVRDAMVNVVENGTGKHAAQEKIKVAAKTGSAQFSAVDPVTGEFGKQTRAWMISFAPYDEPRYAMALIAEGGVSGGGTAGPIVGAIYKKIFQLEQDRKNAKPPVSVPAVPVSEKIEGFEGDVSGELLGDDVVPILPDSMQTAPDTNPEEEDEAPPPSVSAEKANLP